MTIPMSNNFFKNIYTDDIIYHYTKASTAIDHILFNDQLRFGGAAKSIDPIENGTVDRMTVYFSENDMQSGKDHIRDTDELHNFIIDLETQFQQICFCKNSNGEDFASPYYHSQFQGHEELFGFAKPRMWDQYADRYTGVCIAFSKERILSLNKSELELIEDDVQYLTYRQLSEKKVGNIQGDYLIEVGKDIYMNQLKEQAKQSFFYKHKDYSGENEFRIGTLFNKHKCSIGRNRGKLIFYETMMLDISNCIKAIFMSNYANVKQKNDLLHYANSLNIPLIEMNWQHNSFECGDYREQQQLISKIMDKTK